MRLPDDPRVAGALASRLTRDLLLAQALDACIAAERRLPGSSQEIIARQPAWVRGDLQRLLGLAGSLDAAASNAIMSSEFRVAARARLMQQIGGDTRPVADRPSGQAEAQSPRAVSRAPAAARLNVLPPGRGVQRALRKTFWDRLLAWSRQFRPWSRV